MNRAVKTLCRAGAIAWVGLTASLFVQAGPVSLATQSDLRRCLDRHDQVDEQHDALLPQIEDHEQALQRWQEARATLQAQRELLDMGNPAALERYNQQLASLNAQAAQLNRISERWRQQQGRYNQQATDVNQQCSKLVYRHRDMEAVLRERESQGKAR